MAKTITLKRVSYGKKSTLIKDREYRFPGGPVGTKTEWRKWAKKKKLNIRFVEK